MHREGGDRLAVHAGIASPKKEMIRAYFYARGFLRSVILDTNDFGWAKLDLADWLSEHRMSPTSAVMFEIFVK
jgi:hypothetical protein